MRLLVLSTWCPLPAVNGSTLRAAHLLEGLTDRHDVELLAFPSPAPPDPVSLAELEARCRRVTILPRGAFEPVPGARGHWWSSVPRSLGQTEDPDVRQLVRERRRSADLALGFQLPAARYLDEPGPPAILEEAEPRQIETLYREAAPGRDRWRRHLTWWKHARYLRRLAATMAAVTVVSDLERDALVRIGVAADKVHVLPNGADARDLERPRTVKAPRRLVYAGSVTYAPNLEAVRWFLADVLPRVRDAVPDAELWVTGDVGPVAIDRLPNRAWAHFTGRVPDVGAVVSESAVAVVPLRAGGGTRLKVLEALALGTPVVSTSKGAEGLALRSGTDVLLADSDQAFAAAVVEVLTNAPLAQALSAAGRGAIRERFTWGAIGEHLEGILRRTAAGGPA